MHGFQSYITELFDKAYRYHWTDEKRSSYIAEFDTDSGDSVVVFFEAVVNASNSYDPEYPTWTIWFERRFERDDGWKDSTTLATGTGDEFRIFGTVINIVTDWWQKQQKKKIVNQPYEIYFSASKGGTSRGRTVLYDRFAKEFSAKTKMNYSKSETPVQVHYNFKRLNKKKSLS